jgi:hypothetical protein
VSRAAETSAAVRVCVEQLGPLSFGDLYDRVRERVEDVHGSELDAAARPYETGEPGAYLYRLPA